MISTLDLLTEIGFSKTSGPFSAPLFPLKKKYHTAPPNKTRNAKPPIAIPAMAPAFRPLLLLLLLLLVGPRTGAAVGGKVGATAEY
jgi:hypothetical protein